MLKKKKEPITNTYNVNKHIQHPKTNREPNKDTVKVLPLRTTPEVGREANEKKNNNRQIGIGEIFGRDLQESWANFL